MPARRPSEADSGHDTDQAPADYRAAGGPGERFCGPPAVEDCVAGRLLDIGTCGGSTYGNGLPRHPAFPRPYPPAARAVTNGEFMCGQMVPRGDSWAPPRSHVGAGHGNAFYPHERRQSRGLPLAGDGR